MSSHQKTHTMPNGEKMAGAKHKPVMNKKRKDSDKLKQQISESMRKEDDYIN